MRKVSALELISLDGVMESPERWSLQFHDDEMAEANRAGMAEADAMLLGRVTFQEFASYWPYQNSADQPFTDYLNNTPKYVVSTTLEEPLGWNNSTLIKGNVAEDVLTRLLLQPGKDILVFGSGDLVNTLMQYDLIDEYRLMVFPIVLGSGKRLFEDASDTKVLMFTETKTLGSDAVVLYYRPAVEEAKG